MGVDAVLSTLDVLFHLPLLSNVDNKVNNLYYYIIEPLKSINTGPTSILRSIEYFVNETPTIILIFLPIIQNVSPARSTDLGQGKRIIVDFN